MSYTESVAQLRETWYNGGKISGGAIVQKLLSVKIWNDTMLPDAMQKYCCDHNISLTDLAKISIAEKLARTDIHSMTIEEIEEAERGGLYE